MKRILLIVLSVLLLSGCTADRALENRALALRSKLLNSNACSFDAVVTADYGDKLYSFSLNCAVEGAGIMTFTVSQPETISGITGTISLQGGKLTFDDKVLSFSLLADEQLSPVSAPWILYKTLTGGYLTSCVQEGDYLRLSLDDSYEEDALHLDVWLGAGDLPMQAEILYDNRRILTLQIENFRIS